MTAHPVVKRWRIRDQTPFARGPRRDLDARIAHIELCTLEQSAPESHQGAAFPRDRAAPWSEFGGAEPREHSLMSGECDRRGFAGPRRTPRTGLLPGCALLRRMGRQEGRARGDGAALWLFLLRTPLDDPSVVSSAP